MQRWHQVLVMTTVVAVGIVGLLLGNGAIAAQHGHAQAQDSHFAEIAERLELSADQRETLTEPFHEAFAAFEQLHRLHDVIASELTEEQKSKLSALIRDAVGERHHGEARH